MSQMTPIPIGARDTHHTEEMLLDLERRARVIRRTVVDMVYGIGSGHPGGSLSATDLLSALFFHQMRLDPARPDWAERDRLILSKGHAAPALYAALANRGFFPTEELKTWAMIFQNGLKRFVRVESESSLS